jgi:hypothetical protein
VVTTAALNTSESNESGLYFKESWAGNSRDGELVGGEGWHYFRIKSGSKIVEAFELYLNEEGDDVVTILGDMVGVDWVLDFGFANLDELEEISEDEFLQVKETHQLRDK